MPGFARWRLGVAPPPPPSPKLDFTPHDVGMVVVDVALAMATKDMLTKQGLIPADILVMASTAMLVGERPGILRVELPVLYVEKL